MKTIMTIVIKYDPKFDLNEYNKQVDMICKNYHNQEIKLIHQFQSMSIGTIMRSARKCIPGYLKIKRHVRVKQATILLTKEQMRYSWLHKIALSLFPSLNTIPVSFALV